MAHSGTGLCATLSQHACELTCVKGAHAQKMQSSVAESQVHSNPSSRLDHAFTTDEQLHAQHWFDQFTSRHLQSLPW